MSKDVKKFISVLLPFVLILISGTVNSEVKSPEKGPLPEDVNCADLALPYKGALINVPKDTRLGIQKKFCVFKYEAKAVREASANWSQELKNTSYEVHPNGCQSEAPDCEASPHNWGVRDYIAISTPQGKPWRMISRVWAMDECQNLNHIFENQIDGLGMKFTLMSNKEWMAIAWNLIDVPVNWSDGVVGKGGCLKSGNNGGQKPCGYDGENPESGGNPEAELFLSNNESILHFPGNVWEWVSDDYDFRFGKNQYMSIYSDSDIYRYFGLPPERNYLCDESNNHCNFGWGWLNHLSEAIIRGGNYKLNRYAGVLATYLFVHPLDVYDDVGFRCVLRFEE